MDLYILDAPYVNRVQAAGGMPVLIPHVEPADAEAQIAVVDALLITGGDDLDPSSYGAADEGHCLGTNIAADRSEIALVQAAAKRGIPVLGTCRGIQIINAAFGGNLHQEMLGEGGICHGPRPTVLDEILAIRHDLEIAPDSLLARALGTERRQINSTHHQAVKEVAPGFRAVGWAPDGTVEAIESTQHGHILGVQWHPEKLPAPDNQELFEQFIGAAIECKATGN